MSRPAKLTPTLQDAIVKAVSIGIPLNQAAQLAGVGYATLKEWRARGEGRDPRRRPHPTYAAFAAALARARAQDEARRVARIEQAARGGGGVYERTTTYADGRQVREVRYAPPDWHADAWHLERTDPKHWGRRDRRDVHRYREKISKRAKELSDKYDLDIDQLIDRAERYANGLDEDDDG